MAARFQCPRCGEWAHAAYIQLRDGSWGWVWMCPVCGHIERIPEAVVDTLDYD